MLVIRQLGTNKANKNITRDLGHPSHSKISSVFIFNVMKVQIRLIGNLFWPNEFSSRNTKTSKTLD